MRQYKLNEVFEDSKNFSEPKRLKCVRYTDCHKCYYWHKPISVCGEWCFDEDSMFIETDEPTTEKP